MTSLLSARLALLVSSALLAATATAQVGSVAEKTRLFPGSGGFVGPLPTGTWFGQTLANLGDIDADGVNDLAVGAPYDDDGAVDAGAVWILRLASDGTVAGERKLSATSGGFGGPLNTGDEFGEKLASVGDLDGDGRAELAVLSSAPNRLWILFLNADGSVRAQRETLFTDPVFTPPALASEFGGGLVALGDLDGDGTGELASGFYWGFPGDVQAGFQIGSILPDGSQTWRVKVGENRGSACTRADRSRSRPRFRPRRGRCSICRSTCRA